MLSGGGGLNMICDNPLLLLQKFKRQYRQNRNPSRKEVYRKNLEAFIADKSNPGFYLKLAEQLIKDIEKTERRINHI